ITPPTPPRRGQRPERSIPATPPPSALDFSRLQRCPGRRRLRRIPKIEGWDVSDVIRQTSFTVKRFLGAPEGKVHHVSAPRPGVVQAEIGAVITAPDGLTFRRPAPAQDAADEGAAGLDRVSRESHLA